MGHHHKHHGHKHCHTRITRHCKYKPTDLNTNKILFPAGHGNRPQGIRAFCEGLRAFPIGTRHCR